MKKILKFIPIILVVCFLLFWGVSTLKCEVLTWQHGRSFPFPNDINSMCGEMDYLKVLKYTDTNARVYYVSDNRSVGNTATFIRHGNNCEYYKWEKTIWSKSGSADDFVFPYFYHSAEGKGLFFILGIPAFLIAIISLFKLVKNDCQRSLRIKTQKT